MKKKLKILDTKFLNFKYFATKSDLRITIITTDLLVLQN